MGHETEIRAHFQLRDDAVRPLMARGIKFGPPVLQWDQMFDTQDGSLFSSGQKIRIRREGESAELTVKGAFSGDHSASRRTENNISLSPSDADKAAEILTFLGFPMLFQVKKNRWKAEIDDSAHVTLDQWPIIGCLLEFEGDENKIKGLAAEIFPGVTFGNPRLKTLFSEKMAREKKTLDQLIKDEEEKIDYSLGNLEFLIK